MALSNTTKNTIAALGTLLQNDPSLNLQLRSAAERRLSPDDAALVKAISAKNPSGAVDGTAATALTTLLNDVAGN